MTIAEAYIRFVNKVEKNIVNDGMSADKGRFIMLFNEAQNKYVEAMLEAKSSDGVQSIQRLIVPQRRLVKGRTVADSVEFRVPDDIFHFINVDIKGSKGSCGEQNFNAFQAKPENVHELKADEFNKPSFEFRETFYTYEGNNIKVYKDGFDISKVYLTYYRQPIRVDIEGYITIEDKMSTNIDPEWDDVITDRIISICAKDFQYNERNLDMYQAGHSQVISKV